MGMKTHITRIVLQGFKSFNKRISIPFLPGFNVVAGPNGSGKSNIVDGVSFVLGKTSARSMRADRLHELIFHGGGTRSPSEYASVTIYFDNSNKVFGFDEPEIFITRKVNRKGVSVYKINGRTTTREKIMQVLSPAKIQPNGHNIILQGDVTQIIEMNPIERRYVIDEISGIAEYNDKKEKAQRDLDAVDVKLKEAEIIITQRYDIFKKLETERNAAIRYQNLQQQLTTLKASLARKKFETYTEQIKKFDEELEKKEEQNKKLTEETESVENDLEKLERSIREVADKLVNISKSVKIEKEVSDLRTKILITKDKIDFNRREVERLDSLIEKLEVLESKKGETEGEAPRAVQALLKMGIRGVHGTVANLISVPEKYRIAIEVAAGPHLHDVVVDDEDVAAYCIDILKRDKIGRATFLPLNKIRPINFRDNSLLSKSGVVGIASKLIKYDTKFMPAMEFVFGNTIVVENIDVAKNVGIGKARMATMTGDLVERSGAMIGGYYSTKHPRVVEKATGEEIERYREMRKRLMQDTNNLQEDLKELDKKLKSYAGAESAKELLDLEKVKIASERDVDTLREKRKRLHERKVNMEIEINRIKVEKARLDAELDSVKTEMAQYGDMQYVDEKIPALQKFIDKTQKEIASIGLVNMKAIEEFEKFRTEFDEYKKKYEKILEEKKAVLDMIAQIEERRKEVFNKALNMVATEFNKIFQQMTHGTASLELEDPENIESGLIIKANPRGKMLLNIDSMSGGEKTLTALAFLFAAQRYSPSPFYIFDEVDAALDKENSKLVANLIKALSKESQFIVITHNDQTIKMGDRVYGVTMEEGESKIIGLELPKK